MVDSVVHKMKKEEITPLEDNIQKLKTKTVHQRTVTDEIEKSVEAFLAKKDAYFKRKGGIIMAESSSMSAEKSIIAAKHHHHQEETRNPETNQQSNNNEPLRQIQEPETTRSVTNNNNNDTQQQSLKEEASSSSLEKENLTSEENIPNMQPSSGSKEKKQQQGPLKQSMTSPNKFKHEIVLLQNKITKVKTKTLDHVTVTDEIEKRVDTFLGKKESYLKRNDENIANASEPTKENITEKKETNNAETQEALEKQPQHPSLEEELKMTPVTTDETDDDDDDDDEIDADNQVRVETTESGGCISNNNDFLGSLDQRPLNKDVQAKPAESSETETTDNEIGKTDAGNEVVDKTEGEGHISDGTSLLIENKASEENLPKQPDDATKQEQQQQQQTALPPTTTRQVRPLEMVINPDSDILDRPLVALTMAVLTNTDVDLTLTCCCSDPHSCSQQQQAVLGVETNDGVLPIEGDLAMARYLVQRSQSKEFVDISESQQALQETCIDYAESLKPLPREQKQKEIGSYLSRALDSRSYVVGESMTMADVALFGALGWPCQPNELSAVTNVFTEEYPEALRWTNMIAVHPAIQKATQLAMGVDGTTEVNFGGQPLDPLIPGICLLEGAVPGSVVTRLPPDHSGYLHVGHVKAAFLNDYYARRYKGRLIFRLDDTNPNKDKEEYQESIMKDLKLLGIEPDEFVNTSDYFTAIQGYAMQLIENGQAYMDNTSLMQMNEERTNCVASKNRNQTPEEAREKFILMSSGKEEGAAWCLRAKIHMESDNWFMRDPVLFRQNLEPHHRTGTTYKAYPTCDFASPIADSLEGVTHALRTAAFNDQDLLYQWIQTTLGLRRVRIHAFSMVNFRYRQERNRRSSQALHGR